MFQIDLKSRKSIYEQIIDNLKELMITGVLKPEDKLPSVRELSKMLTVNPNTVQKAYRELEYEGYVYTTSGIGTFVQSMEKFSIDKRTLNNAKLKLDETIKELYYMGLSHEEIKKILDEIMEVLNDKSFKCK